MKRQRQRQSGVGSIEIGEWAYEQHDACLICTRFYVIVIQWHVQQGCIIGRMRQSVMICGPIFCDQSV